MSELLVLLTNPLAHSKVPNILNFYQRNNIKITVCDGPRCLSAEEHISRCIHLMMSLPIAHFLICADSAGHYAYLLSQSENGFPSLRKLKSKQSATISDPDDGFWEQIDVQGFCKPKVGLIDVLMQETHPDQTLLVWDSPVDKQMTENIGSCNLRRVYRQSGSEWLEHKNPIPWRQSSSSAKAVVSPASTWRYFEYVNTSENASKFWKITKTPDGLGYETRYGRIGSKGQSRIRTFASLLDCQQSHDNIIHSKLRKGYVEA